MTNVGDNDEPRDSKFAPDGGYIPRILFLTPSGEVMDVTNTQGNPRYKYYYSSAEQIVPAMEKALQAAQTLPPAAVAAAASEQDL
jgi:protein-disulfide reductase (glutathione)